MLVRCFWSWVPANSQETEGTYTTEILFVLIVKRYSIMFTLIPR